MSVTTRREFLGVASGAVSFFYGGHAWAASKAAATSFDMVARTDRKRILAAADKYLFAQPVTVTASRNPRSAGGLHDYSSEGDYWWPDPKHPGGPYIQRDGMSNPENFNAHREAMVRLSLMVPALTAAWALTGDKK